MDSEHPTTEAQSGPDYTMGGKKGRIIIRNLVFDISEKHLRSLLSKFGELSEVNVPINPTNNRPRGFAFAEFVNRNSAVKAITELNGTTYKGRQIILDYAVGKDKYVAPVAPQVQKDSQQTEGDEQPVEEVVEEVIEEPKKQKKQAKQQKEDLSGSLFVRNLPLDMSEETLKEFFQKFGEVKFARVVINKDTQASKGTAFVRFKHRDVAAQVLQKSNDLETLYKRMKYNSDTSRKDELDLLNAEFELEGRRIFVFEALDRSEANQPVAAPKVKPTKDIRQVKHLKQLIPYDSNGKRNIRLCTMGIFEPEETMHVKEQQRREEHVRTKMQKLKNPNFYVSDHRIALKNLPRQEGLEGTLEDLVQDAMWNDNVQLHENQRPARVWVSKDKNVIVVKDQEQPNTGLAFLDFEEPAHAISFMNYVQSNRESLLRKLNNRLPIIEFAIEDARKLRRIEFKRERQRELVKQKQQEKLLANGGKETRTQRKNKVNVTNKLLIDNILSSTDKHSEENVEKVKKLWGELKSRGMKQRLKHKIERSINIKLGDLNPQQPTKAQVKKEQKQEKKVEKVVKSQAPQKENPQVAMKEHFKGLMEDIKSQVLKRKREKTVADDFDEVDGMAERRLAVLKKKVR